MNNAKPFFAQNPACARWFELGLYHGSIHGLVERVVPEIGPRVDLDQVDLEVLVHHQVVAEELVSVVDRVFRLGPD